MTKYNKEMVTVVKLENTDRARDNAHDGPLIHKEVVDKIKDNVECMI